MALLLHVWILSHRTCPTRGKTLHISSQTLPIFVSEEHPAVASVLPSLFRQQEGGNVHLRTEAVALLVQFQVNALFLPDNVMQLLVPS